MMGFYRENAIEVEIKMKLPNNNYLNEMDAKNFTQKDYQEREKEQWKMEEREAYDRRRAREEEKRVEIGNWRVIWGGS